MSRAHELVTRLRSAAATGLDPSPFDTLAHEAADEIERLRAAPEAQPVATRKPNFWGFLDEAECRIDLCYSPAGPGPDGRKAMPLWTAAPDAQPHEVVFYKLTVQQRDAAWREVEALKAECDLLRDALWKACGDDEQVVADTIESQRGGR